MEGIKRTARVLSLRSLPVPEFKTKQFMSDSLLLYYLISDLQLQLMILSPGTRPDLNTKNLSDVAAPEKLAAPIVCLELGNV